MKLRPPRSICVITSSFWPPPPTGVAERHVSSVSIEIRRRLYSSMNASARWLPLPAMLAKVAPVARNVLGTRTRARSEEHTSELQSQSNLVCRLLLEKKKKIRQAEHRVGHRRPQRPNGTNRR